MKIWLFLVVVFLLWPGSPSQNEQGKNCNGPPRIENGDIITLSEKQYSSGSSVEFRCQEYYAMEGQNRSFCDNGTWTKVPICLDPCMIPMAELESRKIEVKNGMNISENTFVQRGHSVELTCKIGYVLEADSSQSATKIHCDGTPPVIPKCKEIRCNPPRISNGYFRAQRTIYYDGDLIRIQCNSGFILEPDNGEKVIECTKNGWSPSPKCVLEITCQADYIEHGTILSPKLIYKEGERIRFFCNEGYRYVDRPDALCTKNGWSTKLQCTEIQCPTPEVTNGDFEPRQNQYMYNNEIEITCRKRVLFTVVQRKYISKCTANGWHPSSHLQCKEIQCLPPQVESGRIQPNQPLYRNNDEIEIICFRSPFFTRIRIKVSKCTANGWDPPASCKVADNE